MMKVKRGTTTVERVLIDALVQAGAGDRKTCLKLVRMGTVPYLTWYLHKSQTGPNVSAHLREVYRQLKGQISLPKLRYLWYSRPRADYNSITYKSVVQVFKKEQFSNIWFDLLPYNFTQATRIAVEVLLAKGYSAADISTNLEVSLALVYKVRSNYKKHKWVE